MLKRVSFIVAVFLVTIVVLSSHQSFSVNLLSVQDPDRYGSRDAYIDEATLVVEPHGGYVEESLYLKYSDHGVYEGKDNLEIVHRFELPQGSVVNDMWLWIGDSVMQAIMMDTWTARAIYDSVVSNKRDPAFLAKDGNQYELHIYPLTSGSYRKAKLNFITPTKWSGEHATAPLPFAMLNSNNAAAKPLDILFRRTEDVWGTPRVLEADVDFVDFQDAKGFHYQKLSLPDIGDFFSLNLTFETQFENGYFYQNYKTRNGPGFFQLGLEPRTFFDIPIDSTAKKYFVGLDLSGQYRRDVPGLLQNVRRVLDGAMTDNDQFRFMAVADEQRFSSLNDWMGGSSVAVKAALDEFSQSDFIDSLEQSRKKHILYCDNHAKTCWRFPGIEELATYKEYGSIQVAAPDFQYADVVAAYDHGHESPLSDDDLQMVVQALDPFFAKGGRLLSYYDYNRTNQEKLASYFIPGLGHQKRAARDLYRNGDGNIGRFFPEHVVVNVAFDLKFNDDNVKVELRDSDGLPVVISKKINNGLLVVSGIWAFEDDAALRRQLDIPLLGLSESSSAAQLFELLNESAAVHNQDEFDQAIIFSNSDSLMLAEMAATWTDDFLAQFTNNPPVMHTINLLDGLTYTPQNITVDGIDYYGSGYVMKVLSDETGGRHFETHDDDWSFIAASLSPFAIAQRQALETGVDVDNSSGDLIEMREVNPDPNDGGKPIFFLGEFEGEESISFSFSAKYKNDETPRSNSFIVDIIEDSSASARIIPTMLAFEHLQDMFAEASYDTAAIVALALKYNLLCDYTSLIALEPNDDHHFMDDPFDESDFTLVLKEVDAEQDSFDVDIYPNPFNEAISISVNVHGPSHTIISIYNLRGQLVAELLDETLVAGERIVNWDARNEIGARVSSGLYFVRISVENLAAKRVRIAVRRILLIK